jgi:cutinase
VLSGYSQGAQVVHKAAQKTSAASAAKVAAVVVFGDPQKGQSFGSITSSKVLTICHSGDNICEGGSSIAPAHLNYQNDVGTAGAFVAGKV